LVVQLGSNWYSCWYEYNL